ncbi:MAG TPA: hypothetical protein VHJ20_23585 [Polyangia bacterium]|nr:hypothetical protein [Polyangia bacterium]
MFKASRIALIALISLACSGAGNPGTGTGGTGGVADTGGSADTGGAPATGGSGGAPAIGGTGGARDPLDTAPWRPLSITATKGLHQHMVFGETYVGVDTRAAKMAGKLVVDLGVDQGTYLPWLGKRGFHVFGVKFYHCQHIDNWSAPYGRDYPTNCRLQTFDGMARGGAENDANGNVTATNNIAYKIKTGLAMLHASYPQEDWGYFLNQDGSVRWSDVAMTGYSHGAQTAAMLAHYVRLYRVVSRSGPRENNCGNGALVGAYDPNNPPFKANCDMSQWGSWEDVPFVTPVERVFSFAGTMDTQFGDDMWSCDHMKYVGLPFDVSNTAPPYDGLTYDGSHRFISSEGHTAFDSKPSELQAENAAFGVLPENLNPNF